MRVLGPGGFGDGMIREKGHLSEASSFSSSLKKIISYFNPTISYNIGI